MSGADPDAFVSPSALGGTARAPRLALLPWGDLIEDFLDQIGVSFEEFSSRMTGGWLFGYVEALRLEGIRTTIYCFSAQVTATVRVVHEPTGAEVILLRASLAYRRLRQRMKDPYGTGAQQMFGPAKGLAHQCLRITSHIAPYLATPIARLAREIRRAGCGAILCQEYEAPRFDVAVAIGKVLRIPVFATFQGGNWQRSSIERGLRPLTLRQCAGLIIGPAVEAARVHHVYGVPVEKICRTFNPLDSSVWRPLPRRDARRALAIAEATRVAIWHGRIDIHRKGLDLLLEAWRSTCALRPEQDLLLLLVGSGVEAETFEREIRRSGVTRLRWIREYVLNRDSVRQYLNAADVYVFPSRHEGFAVAPLEAMACGLPVVASAASGVIDTFEGGELSGGVVVPAADAVSLAEQLGRLLDDRELALSLGARARTRVERAFSPATVGRQLHAFFRDRGGFSPS